MFKFSIIFHLSLLQIHISSVYSVNTIQHLKKALIYLKQQRQQNYLNANSAFSISQLNNDKANLDETDEVLETKLEGLHILI